MATIKPDLAKEWHPTKNRLLTARDFSVSSREEVWWLCSICNSEWKQKIDKRNHGRGCPYCAGQKVNNTNSLSCVCPEVAGEWNYEKNKPLKPNEVASISGLCVWWKCRKGHEWKTTIASRTFAHRNCPSCSKIELKDGFICDSIVEAYVYLKLAGRGVELIYNKCYKGIKARFDFYLPKTNTYIEVTSYNKTMNKMKKGFWFKYLRKIAEKKKYVEQVLGANFRFIHFENGLNYPQRKVVNKHLKRN